MLIQIQGQSQKEARSLPMRFGQGLSQIGPPRPPRKCFYCSKLDHFFLFCPSKTEDEKKGLILVDKFTVRFVNGEPIPMEHNMSIKDCVRKYLPSSIVGMMWGNPELEICSVWDQKPDTGGMIVLSQPIRRHPDIQSRFSGQSDKLSQLKKKISSLKVMMQQMYLEQELIPEPKEENLEVFLKKMAAKFIQTRKKSIPRKQ